MAVAKTTNKKLRKVAYAELNDWRITPRLYAYMNDHPDDAAHAQTPGMAKVVSSLLSRFGGSEDRSGAFHPSQLYTCERAQLFGFLGTPGKRRELTPELINLFNDGHYRHVKWQLMLLQAKLISEVEVPVKVPKYRLTGRMDGANFPERWMLEVKGTSQFDQIKKTNSPMAAHVKQVHGYLVGRPDLDETVILYEDKSTNHWHEILVRRNKTIIREVEGILNALNEAYEHQTLPQVLPECQRGEGAYKQCPYAYLCKQVGWAEAEEARKFGDSEGVIVGLNLKRRNTHQAAGGGASASVPSRVGTPIGVRTKTGTLSVRRGPTR